MDANEIILELINLSEHVKKLHFKTPETVAHMNQANRRIKDVVESLRNLVEADDTDNEV
jgi:hypothetical protein